MGKYNGGIHMLNNIHDTPVDGNFCDGRGNAIKPLTVADCKPHVCCVKGTENGKRLVH